MNIYLGDHFDAFIREKVASGRYANASEVVREALRRFEYYEEKLAHIRALIAEGDADFAAGRFTEITDLDAYFESIRQRTAQRAAELQAEKVRAAS